MADEPGARLRETARLLDEENPWPGLAAFRDGDEAFFKGRDEEIEDLRRTVQSQRLSVLFGASGLGKTSLLRAGLFPALRSRDELPVYIRLDFGSEPAVLSEQVFVEARAEAVARSIEAPPRLPQESLWEYLHRRDVAFWNGRNRLLLPVLVFDQFEEVFSRGLDNPSWLPFVRGFLDELSDIAEGRPPDALKARIERDLDASRVYDFAHHRYRVILSLREDYLASLEELRQRMPSIGSGRFRLQPMTGEQALLVVDQTKGRLVDTAVARKIIRFAAGRNLDDEATALAQLQVEPSLLSLFCRELNARRRTAGTPKITEELVRNSQGNIIEGFYEECMRVVRPELRRFVEDELVTVHGHRDNRAMEDALLSPGITREDIVRLVDARLLRTEDRGGTRRLELSHDVLTGVVRAARDRRYAEAKVEQEQAEERDRLRKAKETAERERLEQEAQLAQLEKERANEAERTSRWFRGLAGALAVMLVVAVGLAIWALDASKRATLETQRAAQEAQDARTNLNVAKTEQARAEEALTWLRSLSDSAEAYRQAALTAIQSPDPSGQAVAARLLTKANATYVEKAQQDIAKLDACPVKPRVFIHITSETKRAAAGSLVPGLEKQGFVVPGIQRVDKGPATTDVRYFNNSKQDVDRANALVSALRELGVSDATPKYIAGYENSEKIRPCHYEIWLSDAAIGTR